MKSTCLYDTPSRVVEGIRRLEGALHEEIVPSWRPEPYISQGNVIQIRGISQFWEPDDSQRFASLVNCQHLFVSGLYGAHLPWFFFLSGKPNEIAVYFGLPSTGGPIHTWRNPIQAAYPGCELTDSATSAAVMHELAQLRWVVTMTGNPSPGFQASKTNNNDFPNRKVGQIESLLRSMHGSNWAYVAFVRPLSEHEINARINFLSGEEREITSAYLRRGTAEENNNPHARRYVDLLRSANEKYELGRKEGMWDSQAYLLASSSPELARGAQALISAFSGPASEPQPIRVRRCAQPKKEDVALNGTTLTTSEVAILTRLPAEEFPGYRLTQCVSFAVSPPTVRQQERIAIGTIIDQGCNTANWFEVARDDVCKHALVAGVPGAGKTHTCFYILRQLWEEHRVPWLVLEPSIKSEYRRLISSPLGPDLRIFTLGDESGVPFRFNPLVVMPGIHVQSHIDGLLALFNAAFAWVPPMPDVLSLAVHRLYANKGWDLAHGTYAGPTGAETQPTLSELINCIESIVPTLGYDAEITGNIRAGLRTRLSTLIIGGKGLLLNSGVSFSMDYLLSKPTVLGLSAVGNDEEKAFLLGAILLAISEFRQTAGLSDGRLRHVTLVEEAHRLLRAVSETVGTEIANPRAKAVETFCNLLAEVRAYGEGLIVVDQIPAKLAPDIVKNTNLKIVHRLVAEDDRRLLGGAMGLTERQQRFLATLSNGQAVVYSENRDNSYLIHVPDHARHHGFGNTTTSKADVLIHMRGRVPDIASSCVAARPERSVPSEHCGAMLPGCQGCNEGECSYRDISLRQILSRDYSSGFDTALENGWLGLWKFGVSVARNSLNAEQCSPQAVYCVLMNLASVYKFSADQIKLMRRELGCIRDWENKN